jgi:hypothetical protein
LGDTPKPSAGMNPSHPLLSFPRRRESSCEAGREKRNRRHRLQTLFQPPGPQSSQPVFARSQRRRGNLGEGRLLRLPLTALREWLAITSSWGTPLTPGRRSPPALPRRHSSPSMGEDEGEGDSHTLVRRLCWGRLSISFQPPGPHSWGNRKRNA